MLQPRDRVIKRDLHVLRQTAAHALQIHFLGVQAARLNEKLVAFLVRKTDNFILNARAVARADALDLSAVERRAIEVRQNHALRLRIRPRDMAHRLVLHLSLIHISTRCSMLYSRLCSIG